MAEQLLVAHRRVSALAIVTAIMAMGPATLTHACKYSVRDVTFVTLGDDQYTLHLQFGQGISDELQQPIGRVAAAVFAQSTIRPQISTSANAGLTIELENPDGDRFDVSALLAGADLAKAEDLWPRLEKIVTSPARQRIGEHMFEAHSIVLIVESTAAPINERTRAIAEQAVERINSGLDRLPKPPPRGPALVTVGHEDRAAERVLLASLDLADLPDDQAALVVMCGRMRPVGPALIVPGAASEDLINHLNVVGADCECGLDRSWMQATALPHRWTTDDESRAFKALGFDPENALVRAEIARILTRGPSSQPGGTGGAPSDPFALLEYSEVDVDPGTAEPAPAIQTSPPSPSTTTQAAAPVAATAPQASPLGSVLIITIVVLTGVVVIGALLVFVISRRAT